MSGFFDEEAQVSDGEDEEYTEKEKVKLKKLKQIQSDDSSEEEDDGKSKISKSIYLIYQSRVLKLLNFKKKNSNSFKYKLDFYTV